MRPAHWFFEKCDGVWQAYSNHDSDVIEMAAQLNVQAQVLQGGTYTVILEERCQVRNDNSTRRKLRRGTWFFARSDGTFQPYSEDTAAELHRVFSHILENERVPPAEDQRNIGLALPVSADRSVVYIGQGHFAQHRNNADIGRVVSCGYPLEIEPRDIQVRIPEAALRRRNVVVDLAQGYTDGFGEGEAAARSLALLMGDTDHARLHQRSLEVCTNFILDNHLATGVCPSGPLQLDIRADPPDCAQMPLYGSGKWFWERSDYDIQAFDSEVSETLEVACARGVQLLHFNLERRPVAALVQQRRLVDMQQQCSYPLLRATWFFQRGNGNLEPYPELTCCTLETTFFGGLSGANNTAPSGHHQRSDESQLSWQVRHETHLELGGARVVCARRGGGFCQVRTDLKTSRLVVRGARELLPSESAPHDPFYGWERLDGSASSKTCGNAGGGQAVVLGYKQQIGQAGLDALSVFGVQKLSGAEVDRESQAAPNSWGSAGQKTLISTDAQVERLRRTREQAAASLQTAARSSAAEIAAARAGLEQVSQQAVRDLAAVGEKLPGALTPIGRPTMQLIGHIVGFSSVIGAWLVGGTTHVVAGSLGVAEKAADASIRAVEATLSGIQTVMSAAQTEFVLGIEGCAILENMINIHDAEFREIYSDIGYMKLARGLSAFSSLQQLCRPKYIHAGVADTLGGAGGYDEREVSVDRSTLALWLRYMRLSCCAYGVQFQTITGVTDPKNMLLGDARTLYERTGITEDKIIHACWENAGYAAPAWLLVEDESTHAVCLVISGSKNNSDWLSNLRCANVHIKQGDQLGPHLALSEDEQTRGVCVHAGIWAAAVKFDERCLQIVTQALSERPGWPLVICGHSLGGGTASLLGIRWRSKGLFPGFKVYAYATPPVVSSEAIARDTHAYQLSFQCSDDFVTRWCLGTSRDIFKAGHALASAEGVVEQLIDASLYGIYDGESTSVGGGRAGDVKAQAGGVGGEAAQRNTQGRRAFSEEAAAEEYAAEVKRKNADMFSELLKQQRTAGTLAPYAVDSGKPYLSSIAKAYPAVTKAWLDKTLEACEERMDSDKLLPVGKCYWLIPILADAKTFKQRRATWAEIADGRATCSVKLLNPPNNMFTYMALNESVISDHCPAPYERCLEALLMQVGGLLPDPEGWVSLFQARPRTGLTAKNSYAVERGDVKESRTEAIV